MENIIESTVDEVNVDGGWVVTHHTRTWDTRARLDSIERQLAEKQAKLIEAQKEFDEVSAKVVAMQPAIDAFNALPKPTPPIKEATSTPIM
jgi:hypothetical protein